MDSRQLGIYGELVSARYLRKKGYKILQTNFHSRFGEIDIIAQTDETLIFVEVKTRVADSLVRPMEAVTLAKQRKIKSAALFYLSKTEKEMDVRFDVIEVLAVTDGDKKVKIHHIPGAFC